MIESGGVKGKGWPRTEVEGDSGRRTRISAGVIRPARSGLFLLYFVVYLAAMFGVIRQGGDNLVFREMRNCAANACCVMAETPITDDIGQLGPASR